LLTAGAKVDETDLKGRTALHYASSADFDAERTKQVVEKCVETLLRQGGANASLRDFGGYNAIHFAAANGHKVALELLLEAINNFVPSTPTPKITPLHLAAHNGHHEALIVLLGDSSLSKASVNSGDDLGRTPLDLAAAAGHKHCLKALLHNGASLHTRDLITKRTPFHAAAASGHVDCLRLLLEAGSEVAKESAKEAAVTKADDVDKKGGTKMEPVTLPRLGSCSSRKIQRGSVGSKAGLNSGGSSTVYSMSDVDVIDASGRTPLMLAALNGNLDVLNFLLLHGANINAHDTRGRTSLHFATGVGHEEVVAALLAHPQQSQQQSLQQPPLSNSLDSNILGARDAVGRTPLHYAAMGGHSAVLISLIQANSGGEGSDLVTSLDAKGLTPLHWAAFFGHEAVLELLLENEQLRESWAKDISTLVNSDSAIALYQAGSSDSLEYFSPLHCASMRGHVTCVEILLETSPAPLRGNDEDEDESMEEETANPLDLINGFKDSRGRNITHVAAFYNHVAVLQLLLGHGADLNSRDSNGATPAMLAAANGQEAALDLMLDSGAEFGATDSHGNTALHHACVASQKTTALQLLDKAAEVADTQALHSFINASNENQKTALHVAGNIGLTEVVHVLLRRGASTTALDSRDSSPPECKQEDVVDTTKDQSDSLKQKAQTKVTKSFVAKLSSALWSSVQSVHRKAFKEDLVTTLLNKDETKDDPLLSSLNEVDNVEADLLVRNPQSETINDSEDAKDLNKDKSKDVLSKSKKRRERRKRQKQREVDSS